jgi:hypothetical protein
MQNNIYIREFLSHYLFRRTVNQKTKYIWQMMLIIGLYFRK